MKKLPDAEFEVMQIIWNNEPPITTNLIMQQLGNEREWKVQTVIVLLKRLIDRGFVSTEKPGKERIYFPVIQENEYLQFETNGFIKRFHNNSITSLIATLVDGNKIKDSDLEELTQWLEEKRD